MVVFRRNDTEYHFLSLSSPWSIFVFWLTFSILWWANSYFIFGFYVMVGQCLLGDEEEEDIVYPEEHLLSISAFSETMAPRMININNLEATLKRKQLGKAYLQMSLPWESIAPETLERYADVKFELWEMQNYIRRACEIEPREVKTARILFYYVSIYNIVFKSIFLKTYKISFSDDKRLIDVFSHLPDVRYRGEDISQMQKELEEYEKFGHEKTYRVGSRRQQKAWEKFRVKEMYKETRNYFILQTVVNYGLHSNTHYDFQYVHRLDFADAFYRFELEDRKRLFKNTKKLLKTNLTASILSKCLDVKSRIESHMIEDLSYIYDWDYIFYFHETGWESTRSPKKYWGKVHRVYYINNSSYFNLNFLQLPWHSSNHAVIGGLETINSVQNRELRFRARKISAKTERD